MPKQTRKQIRDSLNDVIKMRWEALRRGKYAEEYRLAAFKELERTTGNSHAKDAKKNAWDAFSKSKKGKELARKYGLVIPYPPSLPFEELFSGFQDPPPIFKDQAIITPISPNAANFELDSMGRITKLDLSPHLDDGRFLNLRVDMQCGKKEIRAIFEDILMVYWPCANPGKEEKRGHSLDPLCFQVYDMRQQGMSLKKIMWELFPYTDGGRPHEGDEDVRNAYEQVRRADRKAKAMIAMASKPIQK